MAAWLSVLTLQKNPSETDRVSGKASQPQAFKIPPKFIFVGEAKPQPNSFCVPCQLSRWRLEGLGPSGPSFPPRPSPTPTLPSYFSVSPELCGERCGRELLGGTAHSVRPRDGGRGPRRSRVQRAEALVRECLSAAPFHLAAPFHPQKWRRGAEVSPRTCRALGGRAS